ncbi:hypothetical protein PIB30_016841 [Stylosanthes scabra]|uniref:Protein FAR1-RELATED SEQUENCE n=1 Tax=Stylosanthes scabra TaxID=79078 RepID=A0ABU6T7R5_9FABA|nr:hypothetical protein [Stylosanthes scabra]
MAFSKSVRFRFGLTVRFPTGSNGFEFCGFGQEFGLDLVPRAYTNAKFREVQAQFREKANRMAIFMQRVTGFVVYDVLEEISSNRSSLFKRVDSIPPRYILERWSKNIKRRHTSIKSSYDEPSLEQRNKNCDVMLSCSKVHCESASGCLVLTAMVHRAYHKLEADMKEYKAKSDVPSILTHEDGS